MLRFVKNRCAVAFTGAAALAGVLGVGGAAAEAVARAEVRYTEYGIAHVLADSYEGAGLGYGLALARDNLCAVVERSVTLAGERSRSLPADETYLDVFAGGTVSNLDSDAVYLYLFPRRLTRAARRQASPELRALVRGLVEGFNQHAEGPALAGEDCRGQPWFRPISEDDIWRRIAHVPLLETTAGMLREIIAAQPPNAREARAAPQDSARRLAAQEAVRGASNAAAFGRDGVRGGVGGFSFANPHYAWHGTERLHAFHMTIPGELNVFGSTPYGLPFAMLGFTDRVGWGVTHTTDKRSTIYELALDPADPTRYLVDGRSQRMRRVEVSVETQSGSVRRSFWETRYGPVIKGENLPWDTAVAYAFADPERGNLRFGNQFLAIAQAQSVREIDQALRTHMGSPWSNVTAADRSGEVFYSNISVAGNISDAQLARCVIASPARIYMDLADVTTLNGSDSGCAWINDRSAQQPGLMPARLRPSMVRTDVTFNSNDSHWYATLAEDGRLEGYASIIGPERSARGERTRIAALYARQVMEGSALTGAPGVTPENWRRLFFTSRNLTAELILDDLLADCDANHVVAMGTGAVVDIAGACAALREWDRADTLQSRGAALFAEFLHRLERVPMTGFLLAPRYWRTPFDAADPVGTPSGFVASDETRRALADAMLRFQELQVALDAPLGDVQGVTRNGQRLPISGSWVTYHLVRPRAYAPGQGISELLSGDSYMHLVSITPDGVSGRFLVTYSQSTNPSSSHYADMTALFSAERLADVRFSEQEIRDAQVGESIVVESARGR